MKNRGISYLFAYGLIPLAVGLACSALSSSTATSSTAAPASTSATSAPAGTAASSGGLTTFTDQNSYYEIQIPGDWAHTNGTDTNLYWDRFTSPDKNAFVENITYNDGTVWSGSQNGKAALYLLNNIYSFTGKEGDIKISDDSIQPDNSERLTWSSKGGGFSGVSFFEVRKRVIFLMFTMVWNNDHKDTYFDTLSKVVDSYKTP